MALEPAPESVGGAPQEPVFFGEGDASPAVSGPQKFAFFIAEGGEARSCADAARRSLNVFNSLALAGFSRVAMKTFHCARAEPSFGGGTKASRSMKSCAVSS